MKVCINCNKNKRNREFRKRNDNGKLRNTCRQCEAELQKERNKMKTPELPEIKHDFKPGGVLPLDLTISESITVAPPDPREQKEQAMKRMLSSAKARAKEKNLPFNLHYDDVAIPNLCPVLKIPLIPGEGFNDNSPSLDRRVPYLGYTKGNVTVISMKANRIKTDANSNEIAAVLEYVKQIEEENT